MKKIFALIVLSLFLLGCTDTEKTETDTEKTNYINELSEKPELIEGEGNICGGNENITCTIPLFCVFDKDSATGTGTCQNLILDKNLDCNDTLFKEEKPVKNPVCAQIGNQKYTFLNACEAQRRGGKIIAEDFCRSAETVVNNCQATAFGVGMCFSTTEAWEFDGETCKKRFITGCTHEIPFETKAQCEQKCN